MSTANLEVNGQVLSKEAILEKLQTLLKDLLKLEDTRLLTPETRLQEELGIGSLDMVDVVIAIEDAFSIKLRSSTNFEHVKTIEDVADLILNPSYVLKAQGGKDA
jgi:acyl carrier protein